MSRRKPPSNLSSYTANPFITPATFETISRFSYLNNTEIYTLPGDNPGIQFTSGRGRGVRPTNRSVLAPGGETSISSDSFYNYLNRINRQSTASIRGRESRSSRNTRNSNQTARSISTRSRNARLRSYRNRDHEMRPNYDTEDSYSENIHSEDDNDIDDSGDEYIEEENESQDNDSESENYTEDEVEETEEEVKNDEAEVEEREVDVKNDEAQMTNDEDEVKNDKNKVKEDKDKVEKDEDEVNKDEDNVENNFLHAETSKAVRKKIPDFKTKKALAQALAIKQYEPRMSARYKIGDLLPLHVDGIGQDRRHALDYIFLYEWKEAMKRDESMYEIDPRRMYPLPMPANKPECLTYIVHPLNMNIGMSEKVTFNIAENEPCWREPDWDLYLRKCFDGIENGEDVEE